MLHRKRTREAPKPSPAITDSKVSRATGLARSNVEKRAPVSGSESQKSKATPSQRRFSVSPPEKSSRPIVTKPSSLPRSAPSQSSVKLEAVAGSRSGPNVAKAGRAPPNQYRRQVTEDVPFMMYRDTDPAIVSSSDVLNEMSSSYRLEDHPISKTMSSERRLISSKTSTLPPRLIPELQALASHSVKSSYAPSKSLISVSTPSTHFTESPGPWSASTATTTPISWSSASPALVQSAGPIVSSKRSKTVPVPSPARTGLPRLPVVEEPYASKPLGSVVSPMAKHGEPEVRKKKSKPLLESPAPTPPPRISSATRGRSRSSSVSGRDKTPQTRPPVPIVSSEPDPSPLAGRSQTTVERVGDSLRTKSLGRVHESLQHSISSAPQRPSRDGIVDLGESRPTVVNNHRAGFNSRHRGLLASAVEDAPRQRTEREPPRAAAATATVSRSPSRLGKFSGFSLFGRKTKSTPELEKSPKKLQRRGPAAGTGHEGYGKYTKRGRKKSTDSNQANSDSERSVSSTRRISMTTSTRKGSSSQTDLDDFAASRMKPIVMRGGSRSSSHVEDIVLPSAQEDMPEVFTGFVFGDTPQHRNDDSDQTSLAASAEFTRSPVDWETSIPVNIPQLALRRSQRFGSGADSFNLPTPIQTQDLSAPDYISSHDTSQSSVIPVSAPPSNSATDMHWVDPAMLKSNDKKSKKNRWNLFRRKSIALEPVRRDMQMQSPPMPEMAVAIATGPMPRSVPYYAVMDSESENNVTERIGQLLSEIVDSPQVSPSLDQSYDDHLLEEEEPRRRYPESVLLPTAPTLSDPYQPLQPWTVPPQMQEQSSLPSRLPEKRPRLPQVGRIPKVVSRNEHQHRPNRSSFSQPFRRLQSPEDDISKESLSMDREPEQPALEIHTDILPSRPFMDGDYRQITSAPVHLYGGRSSYEPTTTLGQEFLKFPSKHGSEVSTSTSSGGVSSLFGPSMIGTPGPAISNRSPGHSLVIAEDEVWNEYDDILDHVMSPPKAIKKDSRRVNPVPANNPPPVIGVPPALIQGLRAYSPRIQNTEKLRVIDEPSLPTSLTPPVIFPSSLLTADRNVGEDIRLRRSRIVSALHSSIDPSSPFSMADFLNEYGDKLRDSGKFSERLSTSTVGHTGQLAPISNQSTSEQRSNVEHTHGENAARLDVVQRNKDPATTSELHYASLEVSRWLSFGRVLFSPAHDEIHTLPERNVLVIDGLGNEDWSIYCAVTYEAEKAIVYDLKEVTHSRTSQTLRQSQHTPPNHHRVEVNNFTDRFPFQSAFFSAIVLRFPPAMADARMKNIIAECRRTLVPGGHLELMLLDIDIVNMGVHTRKAVRELKMRMTTADRDIGLKPIIDNIQSILGGKGFSSLNRCVVGVPVAGRPTGSIDSSSSSRSSGGSVRSQKRVSIDSRQLLRQAKSRTISQRHDPKLSLNDLVADHSENADAKIGRMVSRTARSWWQHCFEATVIPNGDLSQSVFADKTVLRECKARASSFKLLIAYAQRPVFEVRRRTMSEPTVSTLATVGMQRERKPPS